MNANTNMPAQGLRVLVTAGASGIGYAIAKTFSNAGKHISGQAIPICGNVETLA